MNKELRFNLDYLPVGAHYNNLRYILRKEIWEVIVANIREFKKYRCEYCYKQFDPNNTKSLKYLHCHEVWNFNYANKWQILKNILLLCHNCHNCQHINFAHIKNKEEQTVRHFKKANNLTDADYNYLKRENKLFRKNFEDKYPISRKEMDDVETWFFKIGFDVSKIFVNKENGKKVQNFLMQISDFNP